MGGGYRTTSKNAQTSGKSIVLTITQHHQGPHHMHPCGETHWTSGSWTMIADTPVRLGSQDIIRPREPKSSIRKDLRNCRRVFADYLSRRDVTWRNTTEQEPVMAATSDPHHDASCQSRFHASIQFLPTRDSIWPSIHSKRTQPRSESTIACVIGLSCIGPGQPSQTARTKPILHTFFTIGMASVSRRTESTCRSRASHAMLHTIFINLTTKLARMME
jgi:hypothetical protein